MSGVYIQRSLRFIIVIAIILIVCFSFYYLSTLTYPFLIAWAIALIMNPLVNFLQEKGKLPRPISVLIVLILIFAVIASLLTLLITELVAGTEYLAKTAPDFIDHIVRSIENWFSVTIIPLINTLAKLFLNLGEIQQDAIITNIKDLGSFIATNIASILQLLIGKVPGFLSWFPNAATVLLFTILSTFFISKDWYKIKYTVGRFTPVRLKENSKNVYSGLRKALFGFIRAQLTLISITFVIVLVGLLILQVKYAFLLSLLIGFIDLLPYLGTGLIFVPWIIYEFVVGNYSSGVGLGVLYLVIVVQRQLMEPKIISTNIGVNPLATLVAVFVGLKLFGFIGLIVGPVSLVVVMTLYRTGVVREIWGFIKG